MLAESRKARWRYLSADNNLYFTLMYQINRDGGINTLGSGDNLLSMGVHVCVSEQLLIPQFVQLLHATRIGINDTITCVQISLLKLTE